MLEFPFYQGDRAEPVPDGHSRLPRFNDVRHAQPGKYIPDDGLRDAVNVALLLSQPLLLTGEPGTGKTQLAYSVAWELGFDSPFKFETKSTSAARDLFYVYDALGRYHQGQESANALDYIVFDALGIAILRSCETSVAREYLPQELVPASPCRSVVLIDEVDKAPRDFPNDVLNELEGMYFRVPELGNLEIHAGEEHSPVVIMTSNSEKHLPDAFLRRCVYYHIAFPDKSRLEEIVSARIGGGIKGDSDFLDDALDLFEQLRKTSKIRKKPATAELLDWIHALRLMGGEQGNPLRSLEHERVVSTVSTLAKTSDDRSAAVGVVRRWLESGRNGGNDGSHD